MNIIKHMEVIVFFTYGYSLETWKDTGTLKRELEIYRVLNSNYDIKFTFLTYGNIKDLEFDIGIENSEIVPIYSLMKFNNNKYLRYFNSFTIPFRLKKIIKKSDVIHQHQLQGAWVAILCKILFKKKLYVRTGYDMYEFSKNQQKSLFIQYLYKILTKITLFFSDIYTVTSENDKNLFKENKKIKVRANWVYKLELQNFSSRYSNRLLSIGRLEDQKNYEYLIKEFKNTKDYLTIDIYGSGSKLNTLMNQAYNMDVALNIYESVEHDELLKIYPKYKFFVTTSLYEGNPKTVLEAMAAGCIVIASNIANHAELIKNNINGYLYDLNENNLLNLYKEVKDNIILEKISTKASIEVDKKNSLNFIASTTYKDYLSITK